jgi:serine phosphatase RsbU (regulator of sigma subunit)
VPAHPEKIFASLPEKRVVTRYSVAVAAALVAVLLKLLGEPWLPQDNPFLFFLAAVMLSAWYGGGGPGFLCMAAATVASAFFFFEPRWAFAGYSLAQMSRLLEFIFEGGIISLLGGLLYRAREAAEKAAEGERLSGAEAELANAHLAIAYEKQRRIAETFQRSLLPEIAAQSFPNLDVAAMYESALDEARIGGDFYDAFSLTDGQIAFVVGDVSGKGLAAAERTAEAKYALRALLHQSPAPGKALADLNRYLCASQRRNRADGAGDSSFRFITVALAIVDPKGGDVLLALAGAEPPILVSAGTNDVSEVDQDGKSHNLPLGIEEDVEYREIRFHLAADDTLLLFTDGLTEARRGGGRGAFLDSDGFQEFVRQEYQGRKKPLQRGSMEQMGRSLLKRVQDYSGGKLQDDACLLLVRRCCETLPGDENGAVTVRNAA